MGNAQLTPQKYTHLHLRENVLAFRGRTGALTGGRIQASQTGRTKHLGPVFPGVAHEGFCFFVGC